MAEPLKIKIATKSGFKIIKQDFIPASKMMKALDLIDVKKGTPLKEVYQERVDFLAEVFNNKEVTSESIFNSLNALGFTEEIEPLLYQCAGVDPKQLTPAKE